MSTDCSTCDYLNGSHEMYGGFWIDGTHRWMCAGCRKVLCDPNRWAEGSRRGLPILLEDSVGETDSAWVLERAGEMLEHPDANEATRKLVVMIMEADAEGDGVGRERAARIAQAREEAEAGLS